MTTLQTFKPYETEHADLCVVVLGFKFAAVEAALDLAERTDPRFTGTRAECLKDARRGLKRINKVAPTYAPHLDGWQSAAFSDQMEVLKARLASLTDLNDAAIADHTKVAMGAFGLLDLDESDNHR